MTLNIFTMIWQTYLYSNETYEVKISQKVEGKTKQNILVTQRYWTYVQMNFFDIFLDVK